MEALIETAVSVNSRVVVILSGGEVCEMPWRDKTAGLLLTWFTGEGMGQAAADILLGRISPSGRLANTIPETLKQTPAYLSMEGNVYDIPYTEDIYVGYRYYDKREIAPAYPFGYGLSYSTFAYGKPVVREEKDALLIDLTLVNTGRMRAAQVVQLYVRPLMKTALPRPLRELKDFARITLDPGETGSLQFRLENRDFAYYDEEARDWIVEAGNYAVELGESSREIVAAVSVFRQAGGKRPPLRKDAGFYELFQDEGRKKAFFGWLVEKGLVTREQVGEKMERSLLGSFWAVSAYLDMNGGGAVSPDEFWRFLEGLEGAPEGEKDEV